MQGVRVHGWSDDGHRSVVVGRRSGPWSFSGLEARRALGRLHAGASTRPVHHR